MIARASSGSRSCASSVEPLISANNAVTTLRSPSSEASGVPAPAWTGELEPALRGNSLPALLRDFAHSMQNFALREFSVSHEGQRRVNGEAHPSQNFARSGFSAPHLEQRIANPPKARQRVQTKLVSTGVAKARFGGHQGARCRSWYLAFPTDKPCPLPWQGCRLRTPNALRRDSLLITDMADPL